MVKKESVISANKPFSLGLILTNKLSNFLAEMKSFEANGFYANRG